ncbi:MAG: hypothetical protein AB8H79_14210 [Myxococcota bacterium]
MIRLLPLLCLWAAPSLAASDDAVARCTDLAVAQLAPLAAWSHKDTIHVRGSVALGAPVYLRLQERMAEITADEGERPVFRAELGAGSADSATDAQTVDLGALCGDRVEKADHPVNVQIVAGMGPLAGAVFVERLASLLPDPSVAHLSVLADPNMTASNLRILGAVDAHFEFLAQAADILAVPCNTYHRFHHHALGHDDRLDAEADVPWTERMVGKRSKRRELRKRGPEGVAQVDAKFLDLVGEVADIVATQAQPDDCVYVLSTKSMRRYNLYPLELRRRGLKVCEMSDAQALQVQAGIDEVKEGRDEAGGRLVSQVLEQLPTDGSAHVILGCTELPLALHAVDLVPSDSAAPAVEIGGRTYYDSINVLAAATVREIAAKRPDPSLP